METQIEAQAAGSACRHDHIQVQVHESQFFRKTFAAEMAFCEDCGQRFWTEGTQRQFNEWVLRLKREQRNTFQVQFYLTQAAHEGLAKLRTQFPGVAKSTLIRALTTVFLSAHSRLPRFDEFAAGIVERGSYRTLAFASRKKTSLQFSPMSLLDLQARAPGLNLAPHKIVEDSINKILALQIENDPEYWQDELRPQLELILRSI